MSASRPSTNSERLRGLARGLALVFAAAVITSFLFFTFPLLSHYGRDRKSKVSDGPRKIALEQVNLNEEKKEKKKMKVLEAKPIKAAAKADSGRFALKLGPSSGDGANVGQADGKALVYSEGDVDTEPVPVNRSAPKKPEAAAAAGVKGKVEVEFVVDESGRVSTAKVTLAEPDGYGFREAALNAVYSWRFKPATLKKIPVPVRLVQPFQFE